MAGTNSMVAAVPFIWPVPTIDVFWHSAAEASQNVTEPAVTAEPAAVTVAVSVTGAGDATVLEESVSVVTVAAPAASAACPNITTWAESTSPRKRRRITMCVGMRLQAERNSLPMNQSLVAPQTLIYFAILSKLHSGF